MLNENMSNLPDFKKNTVSKEFYSSGRFSNTIIFLIIVFGLSILSIISPRKDFSQNENRMLAKAPVFSWNNLKNGTFISDYETYVTDQFVARDTWIGLKTYSEIAMLKKDVNGVYLGKDHYLIEKFDESDIHKEQLEKNTQRLIDFVDKYKKQLGANHVYAMIAPTAFEILSDKLPKYATGFNQGIYLQHLQDVIGDNFIDLRKTLSKHNEEYIYYKTDHHWTTNGAYYAYETWADKMKLKPTAKNKFTIKTVSDNFLGTIYSKLNIPVQKDSIVIYEDGNKYGLEYNQDGNIKNSFYEMSHLKTKDQYAMFLDNNNALIKITSKNKNGKTLLIIKDSYANCFTPFVASHFQTTYVIDLRFYNTAISKFIDTYGVTDTLVLYNVNNYIKDKYLFNLVK